MRLKPVRGSGSTRRLRRDPPVNLHLYSTKAALIIIIMIKIINIIMRVIINNLNI